jgi:Arc/MetJ-type ribon-helix-helix transcriptional regulator
VARGGGKKRVDVRVESVTVQFPSGLHDEMVELMRRQVRWFDRQEFIKEAVREKLEREGRNLSVSVDVSALGDPMKAARRRG